MEPHARVLVPVLAVGGALRGQVTVASLPLQSTDGSLAASTADDGPGDGFTVLSAKSLFLGQKVTGHVTQITRKLSHTSHDLCGRLRSFH